MFTTSNLNKAFMYVINKVRLSFKERRLGKLRYIYEQNKSDELIIVFSAFGIGRKYNYMKSLSQSSKDKLFILDNFGYRGSYYWYENGMNTPHELVSRLIEKLRGGYKRIYTVGSSKGGTCAIYFGLKYEVSEIYASACQYHVGSYLNIPKHHQIMVGMMGSNYTEKEVQKLNEMVPEMIKLHTGCNTLINLFYSEKDSTYSNHIVDLKSDLEKSDIRYTVTTDDYIKHGDNGIFFSKHLKRIFNK